MKTPLSQRQISILILAAFLLTLAACWVIPVRMRFGPHGSWYSFFCIGDEEYYGVRLAPLIEGATSTNNFNGMGDRNAISPFFFENAIRYAVQLSGLHIIAVYWLWRILFPVALAASLILMARQCFATQPAERTSRDLWLATGIVAFPLLYCFYDLVTPFPPLQGFINRVPTNVEYLMSLWLAAVYLRFLKSPSTPLGILTALLSVLIVYVRPYLAIPWSITLAGGMGFLVLTGRLKAGIWLPTIGVLIVGVIPWIMVERWNRNSADYMALMTRVFIHEKYQVHFSYKVYLGAALGLAFLARRVQPWARLFVVGAAVAMTALPFIISLLPFSSEVLPYDRFGSFYLIALLAAGMLALNRAAAQWNSAEIEQQTRTVQLKLAQVGILLACILGVENARYDFKNCNYEASSRDVVCVPAYDWIRTNTPANTLFVLDDSDYDLFSFVARRRRAQHPRLNLNVISDETLLEMNVLQVGSLGYSADPHRYIEILKKNSPVYVLWRKLNPVAPHGDYKPRPEVSSTRVYTDKACDIFKIEPAVDVQQP